MSIEVWDRSHEAKAIGSHGGTAVPIPDLSARETGSVDLNHLYCDCDPDKALCGTDVSGWPENDEGDPCVVCDDLLWALCPRCGAA